MKHARKNSVISYVLPKDIPHRDVDFIAFYSEFNASMLPVAFVLSYHRNQSIKWAIIHALLGTPYVAWVLADVAGDVMRGPK